jgi:hypothetical protein
MCGPVLMYDCIVNNHLVGVSIPYMLLAASPSVQYFLLYDVQCLAAVDVLVLNFIWLNLVYIYVEAN